MLTSWLCMFLFLLFCHMKPQNVKGNQRALHFFTRNRSMPYRGNSYLPAVVIYSGRVRLTVFRDKNIWKKTSKITFIAWQYLEIYLKENIPMFVAVKWSKYHVTRAPCVQDDTTIYILNQSFLCTLLHQAADTDVYDFTKLVRLERLVLFIIKENEEVLSGA